MVFTSIVFLCRSGSIAEKRYDHSRGLKISGSIPRLYQESPRYATEHSDSSCFAFIKTIQIPPRRCLSRCKKLWCVACYRNIPVRFSAFATHAHGNSFAGRRQWGICWKIHTTITGKHAFWSARKNVAVLCCAITGDIRTARYSLQLLLLPFNKCEGGEDLLKFF